MEGSFTPEQFLIIVGFLLILASTVSKDEKYQAAYGVLGLIAIFWSFGFFGFGRVVERMVPALVLLFGLFSLYTKGAVQLMTILVTIVLFVQLPYI